MFRKWAQGLALLAQVAYRDHQTIQALVQVELHRQQAKPAQ